MVKPSTRARIRSGDLPNVRDEMVRPATRLASDAAMADWERSVQSDSTLVALDLFSGAGGLSQGFHDAGFCTAAGLDADPVAVQSFAANFLAKATVVDLVGIDNAGVRSLV